MTSVSGSDLTAKIFDLTFFFSLITHIQGIRIEYQLLSEKEKLLNTCLCALLHCEDNLYQPLASRIWLVWRPAMKWQPLIQSQLDYCNRQEIVRMIIALFIRRHHWSSHRTGKLGSTSYPDSHQWEEPVLEKHCLCACGRDLTCNLAQQEGGIGVYCCKVACSGCSVSQGPFLYRSRIVLQD